MYVLPCASNAGSKSCADIFVQVASVYSECGLLCPKNASCDYTCYDPSIAQVYQEQYQTNGQDQLTYVSWARRQGFRPSRYIFDNSAGDDIPVYIVDNGATLSHQVRTQAPRRLLNLC